MNPQQMPPVPPQSAAPPLPRPIPPAESNHDGGIPMSAFAGPAAPVPVPEPAPLPAVMPVPAPLPPPVAPVSPVQPGPVSLQPQAAPSPQQGTGSAPQLSPQLPQATTVVAPTVAQPPAPAFAPAATPSRAATVAPPILQPAALPQLMPDGTPITVSKVPNVATVEPMELSANTMNLRGISRLHVLNVLLYAALILVAIGVAFGGWLLYRHLGSGGSV